MSDELKAQIAKSMSEHMTRLLTETPPLDIVEILLDHLKSDANYHRVQVQIWIPKLNSTDGKNTKSLQSEMATFFYEMLSLPCSVEVVTTTSQNPVCTNDRGTSAVVLPSSALLTLYPFGSQFVNQAVPFEPSRYNYVIGAAMLRLTLNAVVGGRQAMFHKTIGSSDRSEVHHSVFQFNETWNRKMPRAIWITAIVLYFCCEVHRSASKQVDVVLVEIAHQLVVAALQETRTSLGEIKVQPVWLQNQIAQFENLIQHCSKRSNFSPAAMAWFYAQLLKTK